MRKHSPKPSKKAGGLVALVLGLNFILQAFYYYDTSRPADLVPAPAAALVNFERRPSHAHE